MRLRSRSREDAVLVRLEQMSARINHQDASHKDENNSHDDPFEGARRLYYKQERRLARLQESVEKEREATQALREQLDASFRESSERHTSFMSWYRSQHVLIDNKYAKVGVFCPFVTPARRRFTPRVAGETSGVTEDKGQGHSACSAALSISHDYDEGDGTTSIRRPQGLSSSGNRQRGEEGEPLSLSPLDMRQTRVETSLSRRPMGTAVRSLFLHSPSAYYAPPCSESSDGSDETPKVRKERVQRSLCDVDDMEAAYGGFQIKMVNSHYNAPPPSFSTDRVHHGDPHDEYYSPLRILEPVVDTVSLQIQLNRTMREHASQNS